MVSSFIFPLSLGTSTSESLAVVTVEIDARTAGAAFELFDRFATFRGTKAKGVSITLFVRYGLEGTPKSSLQVETRCLLGVNVEGAVLKLFGPY